MTHFCGIVFYDENDLNDYDGCVDDIVQDRLAPYEEGRYNPYSKWDWYTLERPMFATLLADESYMDVELDTCGTVDKLNSALLGAPCVSFDAAAFVDAETNTWHSGGNIGWFGCDDGTDAMWDAFYTELREYIRYHTGKGIHYISVDFHI